MLITAATDVFFAHCSGVAFFAAFYHFSLTWLTLKKITNTSSHHRRTVLKCNNKVSCNNSFVNNFLEGLWVY